MGITATEGGGGQDFDPIEEGMHHAVCYAVYDLGTQRNDKFNKSERKIAVVWELPEQRIELERDGVTVELARSKSKKYTLSLHKKANLRKDLESWRGQSFTEVELEGFDITKLLGINCMMQIIHEKKDDKTYANIASIVPLMKNMEKKKTENDVVFFSFQDHTAIPDGTPEWIIDMIKESPEWDTLVNGLSSVDDTKPPIEDDDDVPF